MKKRIPVLNAMPQKPIVIRLYSDTTITYYFSRDEWKSVVNTFHADSAAKENYMNFIDSVQLQWGVIITDLLPNYPPDNSHLSPVSATFQIFEKLFSKGHFYAIYSNGTNVRMMKSNSKRTRTGKIRYFRDASTGVILYYISSRDKVPF
ncbi:MAG: hypothetical protein HY064_14420 [Bacteroidetes bacterium]|nr:hypothetical protein [Bacteroidota bacterium]